ncbi:MAG: hypothetical protein HWD90_05545 [Campylobacteraceae bacterium]|nr:hypothetical protein [Campylobacteraceae bacterium]
MKNGIYGIEFSALDKQGSGTIVIQDNKLNGGDFGFTFVGYLDIQNDDLTGTIIVNRWLASADPLIPNLDSYTLKIHGQCNKEDNTFTAKGFIEEIEQEILIIKGKRIQDIYN